MTPRESEAEISTPSTTKTHTEPESARSSSSPASIDIRATHQHQQQQEQIHPGSASPITVATQQHHQQLFPKPQPAILPTFPPLYSTATTNHNTSNSSTIETFGSVGSPTTITTHTTKAIDRSSSSPPSSSPPPPPPSLAATTSSSSTTTTTSSSAAPNHPHFAKGEGVKEPRATDVICGRGKMTASHPANRRFRELVDSHKASYQNSKRRDEKTRITCELVDKLRAEGRFVLFDPNSKLWYEVSEEYAREKVSHSLRSRSTSTEQRNATNATNSFRILNSAAHQHEQETVLKIAPRTEAIHTNGYLPPPTVIGNSTSKTSKITNQTTAGVPSNPSSTKPKSKTNIGGSSSSSSTSSSSSSTSSTTIQAAHPRKSVFSKGVVVKSRPSTPRSKHSKLKPGLDDVVHHLIKDQPALLRAMIQKETERFTSAAAMGPPTKNMPLSFKAEATAVSTLTSSLPKMGTPAPSAVAGPDKALSAEETTVEMETDIATIAATSKALIGNVVPTEAVCRQ